MRNVLVWDLPTRVFHWALFALVVTAYLSAEDEGLAYQVHVAAGYGIGLLLVFRVIWGVIGGRHARFTDFARSLRYLRAYTRDLRSLRPTHYVGHNPLGTLMIIAMVATLVGVLLSGLYGGEDLHEFLGELIIVLAVVHVLGVLADSLLTRENLVRAMITGRKNLDEREAAREPGPPPPWRAFVAIGLAVLIAIGAFAQSTVLTWPPPAESEYEDEEDEEVEDDD
ncbi:MAG: cytochrome b/b6 domain-containing protein [Rhodovibrionaceae bacterium]|nr:cytochrome b/b6 domain-containing protein [Rhodovibrionaceae bacterium]